METSTKSVTIWLGYLDPKRKIHVVGGGASAPKEDRPESTPRLYSLLNIGRDLSYVQIFRRQQKTPEGPYDLYPIYPGRGQNRKGDYKIQNLKHRQKPVNNF